MRFSLPIVALLSTGALAVDISGAPACAQTCLTDNAPNSTCDPDTADYTCFCADTGYYSLVQSCVLATCSFSDALATLSWYNTICPST